MITTKRSHVRSQGNALSGEFTEDQAQKWRRNSSKASRKPPQLKVPKSSPSSATNARRSSRQNTLWQSIFACLPIQVLGLLSAASVARAFVYRPPYADIRSSIPRPSRISATSVTKHSTGPRRSRPIFGRTVTRKSFCARCAARASTRRAI